MQIGPQLTQCTIFLSNCQINNEFKNFKTKQKRAVQEISCFAQLKIEIFSRKKDVKISFIKFSCYFEEKANKNSQKVRTSINSYEVKWFSIKFQQFKGIKSENTNCKNYTHPFSTYVIFRIFIIANVVANYFDCVSLFSRLIFLSDC